MNIVIALIISAYAIPQHRVYTCEKVNEPIIASGMCIYDKLKCKIYGIELFKYTACVTKDGKCPTIDECIDDETLIELESSKDVSGTNEENDRSVAK